MSKGKFLVTAEARLTARAVLNRSFTAAGGAEGTNAGTVKTANTVTYCIDGAFKAKTATDNIAVPAGTKVGKSQKCKFLVTLQADGTPVVTQGTPVAATATPEYPAVPAGEAPAFGFTITTDTSTEYTPGTTDNGAAGITDTYEDLSWVPDGEDSFIYA